MYYFLLQGFASLGKITVTVCTILYYRVLRVMVKPQLLCALFVLQGAASHDKSTFTVFTSLYYRVQQVLVKPHLPFVLFCLQGAASFGKLTLVLTASERIIIPDLCLYASITKALKDYR